MTSTGKRSLWGFIGKPVVIVLSVILICTSAFLIWVYMTRESLTQYEALTCPTGAFKVEYNNSTNTYRAYVFILSDDEYLKINEVAVYLISQNGTMAYDLETILDNDESNITYFDKDHDGTFSIDDEFFIDGNIVESNTSFKAIWTINGKNIMETEFG